ncbi:MAG: NifU family protein [Rickettsiales bacterium]|nr:NifU family protein [Rickettsiales bacterium]|tara:strand:+ start:1126 stop:1689 length:564 start_codon:yes stop_codon:yes gene_type:complete
MFIQTEITPNPLTLKFIPGRKLMEKGTIEFKSSKDAESFALAKRLFSEGYISNVFVGEDFLSITKSQEVDWEVIKPNVLSIITDFLTSNDKIIITEDKKSSKKKKYNEKEQEIVKQIEEILDQRIKPAVAQDGGDIQFVKFESGIVFLEMRGACSGCPSSVLTLKSGIENMLKYYIPEIVSVEAVNG